jgi:hypothetical protein
VRIVRGRIALVHDHASEALQDAARLIEFGASSGGEDSLYQGFALRALCCHAEGNHSDALAACDEFLTRWTQTGGYTSRAIELCEITPILAAAGRHRQIGSAALLLPEACRWRDALLLTADPNYADAAAEYEQIGSRPLAAHTRLLAAQKANADGRASGAAHHAEVVLAFAERTGATLYQRQAETLIHASA